MANSPRPYQVEHQIGAATLADGSNRHVINLIEVWQGGFEIVDRCDTSDRAQVEYAANWAAKNRAVWSHNGFPVESAEYVMDVFKHRYSR